MVSDPVLMGMAFVLGAMLGSFLNVCIVRLPKDLSVVRPPSSCPGCEEPIAWYDNIPILAWVMLRGRCRNCKTHISIQYPLIEVLVGLLWMGAVWHFGLSQMALTAGIFGTILLGIAVTDAQTYLIPNEYTIGGLVLGLGLSLVHGHVGFTEALIGAAVGFGLLYVVAIVGKWMFKEDAMGGGDIKMMAMVGSFVGWRGVLLTIFLGALAGTLVFVPLTLRKKRLVPFGVFLAVGAAVTYVVGGAIITWYLQFLRAG